MSHKRYIKDFDSDALKSLRDIVNERLDEIAQEEQTLLWVVTDKWICHKYFKQEDYLQAVEYLCSKARKTATGSDDYRADKDELCLAIETRTVPASEVAGFLGA